MHQWQQLIRRLIFTQVLRVSIHLYGEYGTADVIVTVLRKPEIKLGEEKRVGCNSERWGRGRGGQLTVYMYACECEGQTTILAAVPQAQFILFFS